MTTSPELDDLRKEIAALKEQVAAHQLRFDALAQCLSIQQPDSGQPGRPTLSLTCSFIHLCDTNNPEGASAHLACNENGPSINFFNQQKFNCFLLALDDDVPHLHLETATSSNAVHIGVKPDGGGHVYLFQNGKPRVALQCVDVGGTVAVLHDDGSARAGLLSTEFAGGEIVVQTPDAKTGVRLSGGLPCGGMVQVFQTNGKPGVVLFGGNEFGAISIEDKYGNSIAGLPDSDGPAEG